jgi:hypothetical protein
MEAERNTHGKLKNFKLMTYYRMPVFLGWAGKIKPPGKPRKPQSRPFLSWMTRTTPHG